MVLKYKPEYYAICGVSLSENTDCCSYQEHRESNQISDNLYEILGANHIILNNLFQFLV